MSRDGNIQGVAHLQNLNYIVAESLKWSSKSKELQKTTKKTNNSHNYIDEIETGVPNDTQHQNNAHPKPSPINCDGVLLTNVQCQIVPISILWYREYWTMELKCAHWTIDLKCTRQETITVLYHPTYQHGHTNFWYVCLLEKVSMNYNDCSYNICYVNNKWIVWARTKVVRRKHIIQPTGFCVFSSTCF